MYLTPIQRYRIYVGQVRPIKENEGTKGYLNFSAPKPLQYRWDMSTGKKQNQEDNKDPY